LPDGDQLGGRNRTHLVTRFGDDDAGGETATSIEEFLPTPGLRDEADVLTVRLRRSHQAATFGLDPQVRLVPAPDGQKEPAEHILAEHVQDVALVLVRIHASLETMGAIFESRHPGVVTGCDAVEPDHPGPIEEEIELDVAVALDARVRCPAAAIRIDVRLHHVLCELVAEVEDVVLDAELRCNPAGVVDVGDRTAARVGLAAPELHGHADHVVAGVDQQRGRDR